MRQALAWNPSQRRLLLNGLKNDQPVDGNIIRQPEEMADAIRQHWGPVFSAVNGSDQAIAECLDQHLPHFPSIEQPLPTPEDLASALRRGRASSPGPDRLPYAAWKAVPVPAEIIYEVLL
eukprot:8874134-Pyramimonas_sp.AAC.1